MKNNKIIIINTLNNYCYFMSYINIIISWNGINLFIYYYNISITHKKF